MCDSLAGIRKLIISSLFSGKYKTLAMSLPSSLFIKQKKDPTYTLQSHQKQNQEVNYTVIPYLKKNFKRKINQFFLLPKEDTNQ